MTSPVAGAVALAALAGYALLSAWAMAVAPHHVLTVAALFAPLLAGLAFDGWRRRQPAVLAACAALAALLAWAVARGSLDDVSRLYVLQHAGIHAALAWVFGITLRRGATPLITALAERIHTRFTAEMRAYTRRLTLAWTLYFAAMIGVSLAIYALAPWAWWSLYANLITPLAALALFAGEHVLRHWRHPEFERASLAGALRAYRAHSKP